MTPLLILLLGLGAAAVVASKSSPSSLKTRASGRGFLAKMVVKIDSPAVVKVATNSFDPFSFLCAVAVSKTVIGWASVQRAGGPNAAQAASNAEKFLANVITSNLSETEKVRAIVLGLVMPLITSFGGSQPANGSSSTFTLGLPVPALFAYANSSVGGGTEDQQSRIAHALLWVGYYLTLPKTACVYGSCDLLKDDSSFPQPRLTTATPGEFYYPGVEPGQTLNIWRDNAWIRNPTGDQRLRAALDLYRRATAPYYSFNSAQSYTDAADCDAYIPNPCAQTNDFDAELHGIALDMNEAAGLGPVQGLQRDSDPNDDRRTLAIEAGIQKILQLTTRCYQAMLMPHAFQPPPSKDVFAIIAGAIGIAISAVVTVVTAGAGAGLIATSVAGTMALVAGGFNTILGLAKAFSGAKNVADAVHIAASSSFGKSLITQAGMLMPPDLQEAALKIKSLGGTIGDVSLQVDQSIKAASQ